MHISMCPTCHTLPLQSASTMHCVLATISKHSTILATHISQYVTLLWVLEGRTAEHGTRGTRLLTGACLSAEEEEYEGDGVEEGLEDDGIAVTPPPPLPLLFPPPSRLQRSCQDKVLTREAWRHWQIPKWPPLNARVCRAGGRAHPHPLGTQVRRFSISFWLLCPTAASQPHILGPWIARHSWKKSAVQQLSSSIVYLDTYKPSDTPAEWNVDALFLNRLVLAAQLFRP